MIRRFSDYLGPARLQALFFLLAGTGLLSLILNSAEGDWVRPAQTVLVLVFFAGALIIFGTRLDPEERGRWTALALPAVGAVALGLTVLPQYALPLLGAALGWIIAGLFVFRPRARMEYQVAVKSLRKNQFAEAVKAMDAVIKAEPNNLQHYRFRAEILRLWGKLDRAKRAYQQMTKIDPASAVGYNGLAEVNLQAGDYDAALEAARQAYSLASDEWVAAYNLGMIEDRLGQSDAVIEHLNHALARKVQDARHRLLIRLYLARAYSRRHDLAAARAQVDAMAKDRRGLTEWRALLQNEQAATLRAVLDEDVNAAEALLEGRLDVAGLTGESAS